MNVLAKYVSSPRRPLLTCQEPAGNTLVSLLVSQHHAGAEQVEGQAEQEPLSGTHTKAPGRSGWYTETIWCIIKRQINVLSSVFQSVVKSNSSQILFSNVEKSDENFAEPANFNVSKQSGNPQNHYRVHSFDRNSRVPADQLPLVLKQNH